MIRPFASDDVVGYDEYDDYNEYDEYADYGDYGGEPPDRRWLWVAGVATVVLIAAVIGTIVIIGAGDSTTTAGTVAPPTTSRPAATTTRPPLTTTAAPPPPAATSLPPETATTVAPSPTASAEPTTTATTEAPPAPDPRTVTYRITGNRQLIDLVTVIYTDQQGALRTDVNVALPWTKTVVLDPGVELSSVTATSVAGQLNCSITDASGAMIAEQNNNTIIATCTK
jgi:Mycobacterium membrane protein